MRFQDVVGQEQAAARLRAAIDGNRLPHALLLVGDDGGGGLPLAWAAAQYIVCEHRADGEPCGQCPACRQASKLNHPDIHFVYPVVNKGSGQTSSTSADYAAEWRQALTERPTMTLPQWVRASSGDGGKQAQIFVTEAARIIQTLSTKPFESDYRVMIVWMPELLKEDAANKLLKIIEEPYEKTYFFFVSASPDRIIGTIQSRVQRLALAPAEAVAAVDDEERAYFFDRFCAMMRLSYARRLFDMRAWSDEMASLSRERQKDYLRYAQRQLRENFVAGYGEPSLGRMLPDEAQFASRFSPFVTMRNVVGIMDELARAELDVGQNVNSRMVFFDLSLKLIMLLKPA